MRSKFDKVCYYISIFVIILGLIMTAMSLVVIMPSFTPSSLIVPGAFVVLTIVGIFFAVYYKKKIRGTN